MVVDFQDVTARLVAEFAHALKNGQVVAYFQPEVELSSGMVVAAESLARWQHPELGTLSPVLFAPLAGGVAGAGATTSMIGAIAGTGGGVLAG